MLKMQKEGQTSKTVYAYENPKFFNDCLKKVYPIWKKNLGQN